MSSFRMSQTKRGIILGAGHGIGHKLFELINEQYPEIDLIGTYRDKASCQNPKALYLDPLDEKSITEFSQNISEIDFVFSTIGFLGQSPEKSLRNITLEGMTKSFQVNCLHFPLVMKHLYRKLNKNSLLAVLSAMVGSSSDNRLGGWYGYRSSKSALNMVVKNMSLELKKSTVVAVHPGTTQTNLSKNFLSGIKHQVYTPEKTAQHLLDFFEGLTNEDSGKFFHWNGKEIPY